MHTTQLHLEKMNSTDKSCTCNNRILVNYCLFQVALNLGEKGSISYSTENPNGISSIHVSLAIHVLHKWACHNNNLKKKKSALFTSKFGTIKQIKLKINSRIWPHQQKEKAPLSLNTPFSLNQYLLIEIVWWQRRTLLWLQSINIVQKQIIIKRRIYASMLYQQKSTFLKIKKIKHYKIHLCKCLSLIQ